MTDLHLQALVYAAGCLGIAWSGFCRLVWVDVSVSWIVRGAFWALTVCAVTAATHALAWCYVPGWPSAAMAVAMAVTLAATSTAWREGVPAAYKRRGTPWGRQ